LGIFLYLLYPVIPTYPPFDELKVTNGTLSFRQIGARKNRHYPLFLDGEIYNCNVGPLGSRGTCFNEGERAFLTGRYARVYWYEQSGRFGIRYPVAMQVEISGKVVRDYAVLDYQKQMRLLKRGRVSGMWIAVVLGIALFLMLRLMRHLQANAKAREHNKEITL
jgi:hypothetical protein